MKLFLLEITDAEFGSMPYDRTRMILVEAEDEGSARTLADKVDQPDLDHPGIWLDTTKTVCKELSLTGTERLITKFSM